MNPLVKEWIKKAEGDAASARRELAVTIDPNYDAVCFHAQQCIEKYLKACLQNKGVRFPKTHDLMALSNLLQPAASVWPENMLARLTAYAVEFRCPGESADKTMAQEAVDDMERLRVIARTELNLDTHQL